LTNCICLIVSTDGRFVGVSLTPTGRFIASRQPNLGLAQSKLGLAQAKLGLTQPNLGLAQAKLGLTQPNLGLAQPNLGCVQADCAAHRQLKLSESMRRINDN
jgi:hypothetical protein